MAEINNLTFVDSVNICLSAIGEQPTTGDTDGKVTVAAATNRIVQITSDVLKEVTIDVENRGWDFQASAGTVEGIDITSSKYDWNSLHTVSFKRYVTIRSARILQARYVTDETLHTFSAAEEAFSYANLQQVDATARLGDQFKIPDSIKNLGIEKTDFLAGTVEEKLGYLKMATEVNNTQLVNAQKLRVDEETDLLEQQFLTEEQETAKRTAEKDLLLAQELKVDQETAKTTAETALIADQEALVTQQALTEAKETAKREAEKNLIVSQKSKTDAEKDLINDQESLVTQQALTEAQETVKRTAEKDLLLAQELQVDAQTAKTTAERNTETRVQQKIEEETDLLQAQEERLTAETVYMITAEKDYLDVLKTSSVATSNLFYGVRTKATYASRRYEFRMMGVTDARFSTDPAYKKLQHLSNADSFSQSMLDNTTSQSLGQSRNTSWGHFVVEMSQKLGYGLPATTNDNVITRWLYDNYLNNLFNLGERKLSWTRKTIKLTADSNGRLKAPLTSGFITNVVRTDLPYSYYKIDGKILGYEAYLDVAGDNGTAGEDYNILVDLSLDENQTTSFKGEYLVEVGADLTQNLGNGIAPLFENWIQAYTLLQFVESYPINSTEIERFRKDESRFRALMEEEETQLGQYNILDSADVAERIGHNRNYNLF